MGRILLCLLLLGNLAFTEDSVEKEIERLKKENELLELKKKNMQLKYAIENPSYESDSKIAENGKMRFFGSLNGEFGFVSANTTNDIGGKASYNASGGGFSLALGSVTASDRFRNYFDFGYTYNNGYRSYGSFKNNDVPLHNVRLGYGFEWIPRFGESNWRAALGFNTGLGMSFMEYNSYSFFEEPKEIDAVFGFSLGVKLGIIYEINKNLQVEFGTRTNTILGLGTNYGAGGYIALNFMGN